MRVYGRETWGKSTLWDKRVHGDTKPMQVINPALCFIFKMEYSVNRAMVCEHCGKEINEQELAFADSWGLYFIHDKCRGMERRFPFIWKEYEQ